VITSAAAKRFWASVDTSAGLTGCWPWLGRIGTLGYGVLTVAQYPFTAHTIAYELLVGPVPAGLTLDHRCHTDDASCPGGNTCPHRHCVNPAHLEPVTALENVLRGRGPSAVNARKTHCMRGHAFDADNTTIRLGGGRECRACNRQRQEAALVALNGRQVSEGGQAHVCVRCDRVFPTAKSHHIHLVKAHPGPETDAELREIRLAIGRASWRRSEGRRQALRDEQAATAGL
jgi:hypothetical protein